jgi:UDP-N-acetylmuramyl tripeptide synthase
MDEFELGWRLSTGPVVAVTGTNGKSTTVALVQAALAASGENPVVAGNVNPDRGTAMSAVPPEHQSWVVAEVSSYQAVGCPEFLPAAAVLTNLTEDHLHWHGSMDAYATAVEIETRLPGSHNAANVAAALALADGLGLPREPTLAALATAKPVAGRFEPVEAGQPFDVIVDYAHTPDGVAQLLDTARELVSGREGRVIVVMGRPARCHRSTLESMGRALRARTDHLVLCATTKEGTPRLMALAGLLAGARGADGGDLEVVLDRREAIAQALSLARPGDLVAILGRGPETRIAFDARGGYGSFDDREAVRELLA